MKPRATRLLTLAVCALALVAFVLAGCGKKDSGGTAPSTSSGTLSGLVTQSGPGTAVQGAAVTSSAGGSTTTDAFGRFTLGIPANQDVQVNVTKASFTLNQLLVRVAPSESRSVTVGLLAAGATQSVAVASGGTVTDPSSNATIDLPPDFVTASGPVTVTITGLDPTTNQIEALPGGLEAVDGTGATKYLKPVSFAEYTVKDAAGNVLQFNPAASSGADIELPIPASLIGQPGYANGDPIECYVYDAADGKWKTPVPGVIGPSSVDGEPAIKATIFHLSWYGGAPASDEVACVTGVVRDGAGQPMAGVYVEAFPGGATTTNAQGQYQVQAAANSMIHIVASKAVSGTVFLVGTADVMTGGTEDPCAQADLVLAESEGSYIAYAYTALGEDSNSDLAGFVVLNLTVGVKGTSEVPVPGATVTITDGTTTWPVPDVGNGGYAIYPDASISNPFIPTPGTNLTMRIDYDGNSTIDASGSVRLAGRPVITSPTGGSTTPASFNVTWTDPASSVAGYAPIYIGSNSTFTKGAESSIFLTGNRSFLLGTGVTDPVTFLPNPPLVAGDYQLAILCGTGPFVNLAQIGQAPAPNLTGPNTVGYFYSVDESEAVDYSSNGTLANGAQAVRSGRARSKLHGFEPWLSEATVRATLARARAAQRAGGRAAMR